MTNNLYTGIIFLEIKVISKIHRKEKTVKALLAALMIMPMTMSQVVAEEKESFDFKLNDQGKWCGKFYSNRWTNNLRYQCKFQDEWERLGVTFPDTEELEKMVDFDTHL